METKMSPMFCFQCQETAQGTGCTQLGICGKKPSVAQMLDMLLFVTRGTAVAATALRNHKIVPPKSCDRFVSDALFSTITNVNFDETALSHKIATGFAFRDMLTAMAAEQSIKIPQVDETIWHGHPTAYIEKAKSIGVLRTKDEDRRSLTELITYGLKGMTAYLEHARNLRFEDGALDAFVQKTLATLTTDALTTDAMFQLVLQTGAKGIEAMALLDKANTSSYGHPSATKVSTDVQKRPGILVSGHDLRDLEMLLDATVDSGIDVYTHGEMLPAHYYPFFKKYKHLVGNYGGAWWRQRQEFEAFNGPILMTTNCLVPPSEKSHYKDRIFTTNAVGYPGCRHILSDSLGNKDFGPIIAMAKHCAAPTPLESVTLTGGYAHDQIAQAAPMIVEAVKKGHIRKFVVMAGCDGRMIQREYYTDFAKRIPQDCLILTAGCAKYRFNKMDFGTIDGIPRLLDAGQCNDSYSLILTVDALRQLLDSHDINSLPIVYNIAWYEQKAVIVLLALLSMGIKNIHIGPTLPAFLSTNVREKLMDSFQLSTPVNVEQEVEEMAMA